MTTPTNFEEALDLLRPTELAGVSSPYYLAALYCQHNELYGEAIELLKSIPKSHWQSDEAIELIYTIYQQQISKLKADNLQLRALILNIYHAPTPKDTHFLFEEIIHKLQNTAAGDHNTQVNSIKNAALTFSFAHAHKTTSASEASQKTNQKTTEQRSERHLIKLDS